MQAVRAQGGSAALYVITSQNAAVLYGVDAVGSSDTHLAATRGEAARSVAPPTAGKNVEQILNATLPSAKGVDPAFAAHVTPMRQWAFACWEQWAPLSLMQDAVEAALAKLSAVKGSPWHSVAGPTTAIIVDAAARVALHFGQALRRRPGFCMGHGRRRSCRDHGCCHEICSEMENETVLENKASCTTPC